MLELDASIGAGQAPVYGALGCVALGFPSTHFLGKRLLVGDAPIQTLAREHRELDLGHVQPRAELGCVVDLQLRSDAPGLGRDERFIQGGWGMGVEVVHHQHYSLGLWVVDLYRLLYAVRPVDLGPPLGDADVTPAGQGLANDEEVGRPLTFILVVLAGRPSRGSGKWLSNLCEKLLALLVEAHLREALIVGAAIDFQNIFHAPDKGGVLFWRDRPSSAQPGLELTLLKVRRTNSLEMGSSAHSRLTKRSARRRTLQRFLPFGGSEQASAIRCACCKPSSFLGLVFFGLRWRRAASRPSQANLSRTRETVERLTSRASAIFTSGQASLGALPPSSALSRMRAWDNRRAGAWPLAIKSSSRRRSSAVKLTGFFLLLGMRTPP